jgi:hypothetical protein
MHAAPLEKSKAFHASGNLRKYPRASQRGACIVWGDWSISSAGEVERSR